jgi:hypothetical protein
MARPVSDVRINVVPQSFFPMFQYPGEAGPAPGSIFKAHGQAHQGLMRANFPSTAGTSIFSKLFEIAQKGFNFDVVL